VATRPSPTEERGWPHIDPQPERGATQRPSTKEGVDARPPQIGQGGRSTTLNIGEGVGYATKDMRVFWF